MFLLLFFLFLSKAQALECAVISGFHNDEEKALTKEPAYIQKIEKKINAPCTLYPSWKKLAQHAVASHSREPLMIYQATHGSSGGDVSTDEEENLPAQMLIDYLKSVGQNRKVALFSISCYGGDLIIPYIQNQIADPQNPAFNNICINTESELGVVSRDLKIPGATWLLTGTGRSLGHTLTKDAVKNPLDAYLYLGRGLTSAAPWVESEIVHYFDRTPSEKLEPITQKFLSTIAKYGKYNTRKNLCLTAEAAEKNNLFSILYSPYDLQKTKAEIESMLGSVWSSNEPYHPGKYILSKHTNKEQLLETNFSQAIWKIYYKMESAFSNNSAITATEILNDLNQSTDIQDFILYVISHPQFAKEVFPMLETKDQARPSNLLTNSLTKEQLTQFILGHLFQFTSNLQKQLRHQLNFGPPRKPNDLADFFDEVQRPVNILNAQIALSMGSILSGQALTNPLDRQRQRACQEFSF